MALEKTLLAGAYTWDGTLTALTPNTAGIAVGDFIKQGEDDGENFKITDVDANVSVTFENPFGLIVPNNGITTAYKTEEGIAAEIQSAGDVVIKKELQIVTQADDAATIPNALAGTWTWPTGTADPSTVTTGDTSGIQVGEYIHKTGEADDTMIFEVESIVENVSVGVKNPSGKTMPGGTGATRSHARTTKQKYSSPTIQVGKEYHRTPTFGDGPNTKSFKRCTALDESIV